MQSDYIMYVDPDIMPCTDLAGYCVHICVNILPAISVAIIIIIVNILKWQLELYIDM